MTNSTAPNAAQPKSRRRWYQFGLRTLLIVVTIPAPLCFCSGCGSAAAPNDGQGTGARPAATAGLLKAAHEGYDAAKAEYTVFGGASRCEALCQWSKRWMEAECREHGDSQTRIAAIQSHRDRMKELAEQNDAMHNLSDGGDLPPLQFTKFYLLEAQQMLDDAKQGGGKR